MTAQYKLGPPDFYGGSDPGTTTLPSGTSPVTISFVSLLMIRVDAVKKTPVAKTLFFLTITPSATSLRAPMKQLSSTMVGDA